MIKTIDYIKIIVLLVAILSVSCKEKAVECNTPTAPTYEKDMALLVETNCFSCHAPDVYKKKASRTKIYDYASLKKMGESGTLIGAITHAKGYVAMPYKKGVKIDSCDIEIFKMWVNNGMVKK